jgi:hypothetical protein
MIIGHATVHNHMVDVVRRRTRPGKNFEKAAFGGLYLMRIHQKVAFVENGPPPLLVLDLLDNLLARHRKKGLVR